MTLAEFLNHLERALHPFANGQDELPHDWVVFRRQCEAREEAGRVEFGDAWKTRDNALAGNEEAADGGNYAWFESERVRLGLRPGDPDEALQLATIAAQHFFLAHQALQQLQHPTS